MPSPKNPAIDALVMGALTRKPPTARRRTIQHDFYVYVDTVVMTVNPDRSIPADERLEVLVMHRPESPSKKWALPGGAVGQDERLEDTAIRKVREETGISLRHRDLHQVGAYGDPDRDDRFRAISIAYMALVPHPGPLDPQKHSDAASWQPYRSLRDRRNLEFDHHAIIYAARKAAWRMLEDTPVALSFCQSKFTMSELRGVYEAFLQDSIDPANFRRKVESAEDFVHEMGILADTSSSRGRPPMLYRPGKARELNPPIRFRRSQPTQG